MPNWCNNTATFSHTDPGMIRRVVDGYTSGGLFTEFHPTPDALVNTEAGSPDPADRDEHLKKEQANLADFGHRNWYDWRVANWGTKWDVTQEGNGDPAMTDDGLSVSISFDSAWSPPVGFYEHMTDVLDFVVDAYYYEPGMAFCGRWSSEGGDHCIDIRGNSDWAKKNIPDDIDEAMGISEGMADWEDESSEPKNTNNETGKAIEA